MPPNSKGMDLEWNPDLTDLKLMPLLLKFFLVILVLWSGRQIQRLLAQH